MPRQTAEEKLAIVERRITVAAARAGRLDKYRKRLDRQASNLRRYIARRGPMPTAAITMNQGTTINSDIAPSLDRAEHIRTTFERYATEFAEVLGVVKPRVLYIGERGACRNVARAHIHTGTEWKSRSWPAYKIRGRVKHHRGTICLRPSYVLEHSDEMLRHLAAHEMAHLTRSTKRRGRRGHGVRMEAVVKRLLDPTAPTVPLVEMEEETMDKNETNQNETNPLTCQSDKTPWGERAGIPCRNPATATYSWSRSSSTRPEGSVGVCDDCLGMLRERGHSDGTPYGEPIACGYCTEHLGYVTTEDIEPMLLEHLASSAPCARADRVRAAAAGPHTCGDADKPPQ